MDQNTNQAITLYIPENGQTIDYLLDTGMNKRSYGFHFSFLFSIGETCNAVISYIENSAMYRDDIRPVLVGVYQSMNSQLSQMKLQTGNYQKEDVV